MDNMEKVELINSGKQMLDEYFSNTEEIFNKQFKDFSNLLAARIVEVHKGITLEEVVHFIESAFADKAKDKVNELFQQIKQDELVFYEARLKTAELVFNSSQSDRNKTIYLDNQLKKIDGKIVNVSETISNVSGSSVNEDDIFGIYTEFEEFVRNMLAKLEILPGDETKIKHLIVSYYDRLKGALYLNLENLLKTNKYAISYTITEKIDESKIRNGKTTAASKIEKSITSQAIDKMEMLLKEIVEKNKGKTKDELKRLSTIVISSIFVSLPEAYKDQRELLDVIVETNIIDRLGGILDRQLKFLERNINEKNYDLISYEFYEEKRYKNIPSFVCDFDSVSTVYRDVLDEIVSAYDLDKGDMKIEAKSGLDRINTTILNITNTTKIIFNTMVNNIMMENDEQLKTVISGMYSSKFSESQRLVQSINEQNDIVTGYKINK